MTRDAVFVLKHLLTVTRLVTDGRTVLTFSTTRIDLGGIENKRDTQCAENGSFIDDVVPKISLQHARCGAASITKTYKNKVSKIRIYGVILE